MTPLIVIPAAGASSRMNGRDKLMEDIDGAPLLKRQVATAVASGAPVMVATRVKDRERQAALDGLKATLITVRDADDGLGATLRTAARFAARHTPDRAMMVLLPDVPDITVFDIKSIIARFQAEGGNTPARASNDRGQPGTPLIVPARLLPRFAELTGDDGGKAALQGEEVILVPLSNNRATRDLDTPEDWARWRAEQGQAQGQPE